MHPEYENNQLVWDGCELSSIAAHYCTPLHILSRPEIDRSILAFIEPFRSSGVNLRIHYSVKTNPIPEYLKVLKSHDLGVEIVRPWEFQLVRQLGFDGSDIVITGIERDEDFCIDVAKSKPKMWNLESLDQLTFIENLSGKFPDRVNIGFRICPSLKTPVLDQTLASGSSRSPYGFMQGSDELSRAFDLISKSGKLEFVGFHFHIGSGIRSPRPYAKSFSIIPDLVAAAQERGLTVKVLDIGGGYGISSAPVLNPIDLLLSWLGRSKPQSIKADANDLLGQVALELRNLTTELAKRGVKIDELIAEPGRALSASTMLILLTVQEVVKRPGNRNYIICDAGAMSLSTMLLVENHRVLPLRHSSGPGQTYTILGNMPSALDRVSSAVELPEVRPGDHLAILDTGAYFYSFGNNFAGPRPGIVMIDKGTHTELRRRETIEDITSLNIP